MENNFLQFAVLAKEANLTLIKYFDNSLARLGLSFSQALILLNLYDENGVSQKDLQNKLKIESPSLTKSLDLLDRKNLIMRKSNNNDKRVKNIFLTVNGRNLEFELQECLKTSSLSFTKELNPVDLQKAIDFLVKIKTIAINV